MEMKCTGDEVWNYLQQRPVKVLKNPVEMFEEYTLAEISLTP